MEFTPHDIWEVLVERFDENEDFSRRFGKRKAWEKIYYNLDTDKKETCIVVDYNKKESRLELDIYFFERRHEFDRLYAQRDLIEKNENVNLSYEVRTERTQGIYLKRYDIKPEGDRAYLEELVGWIQEKALLLCYINEKYGLGKNVIRPRTTKKPADINAPMLPKEIVEIGDDYAVKCGNCGETFRRANRCTFCGQMLKWPEKDELSSFLIRREGNKRQLIDADDWATVTAFNDITRQQALGIVEAFSNVGFEYHVGTADLVLDYKAESDKFCGLMLSGNEKGAAFQPSEFFEYAQRQGKDRSIIEDFLRELVPYLSKEQKNRPYDNEKGYYYITYSTLYTSLNDIVSIYRKMLVSI